MPLFKYNSLTDSGRSMEGTIEAASQQQAHEMLTEMNLTVNEIQLAKQKPPSTHVGRSEFLLFNQQLASITKAGIPLEKGLRELTDDIASASMRKLVNSIADDLDKGISIDEAIDKRQKHFPALYGEIVKAGVKTGRLSEMLTSLNRHLETTVKTRRIIMEAMTYPIITLTIAAIVATAIFTFIIPTFSEVLMDMGDGASLPALTKFYMATASNFVPIGTGFLIIIGVIVASIFMMGSSVQGRIIREKMLMWTPLLGRIHYNSVLSRMSDAMAVLVAAGTPMPACLRLSAASTGSENMKAESNTLANQIEQGAGLYEAGYNSKMLPKLFLYSIQLGSQRNELQDNLHSLGQMYKDHTRSQQAGLQALLMPVMLIVIGLFIGTTITAMFLPMVSIIKTLM